LCILIGDSEIDRGIVTVKDLALHSQDELPRESAVDEITARLAGPSPERSEGSS
jgi:histidyl-tRNA synthetase